MKSKILPKYLLIILLGCFSVHAAPEIGQHTLEAKMIKECKESWTLGKALERISGLQNHSEKSDSATDAALLEIVGKIREGKDVTKEFDEVIKSNQPSIVDKAALENVKQALLEANFSNRIWERRTPIAMCMALTTLALGGAAIVAYYLMKAEETSPSVGYTGQNYTDNFETIDKELLAIILNQNDTEVTKVGDGQQDPAYILRYVDSSSRRMGLEASIGGVTRATATAADAFALLDQKDDENKQRLYSFTVGTSDGSISTDSPTSAPLFTPAPSNGTAEVGEPDDNSTSSETGDGPSNAEMIEEFKRRLGELLPQI
jgi:hypothetical protein